MCHFVWNKKNGLIRVVSNVVNKGSFGRKLLIIFSGTVTAQLVLFGTTPLVTRLYSAHDMGVFALSLSLMTTAGGLASMGYDLAIFVPKKEQDAQDILSGLYVLAPLAVLGVVLIYVKVLPLFPMFEPLLRQPALYGLLYSGGLITALYTGASSLVLRRAHLRLLATTRILRSLSMVSLQIVLGLFTRLHALGLILGFLIGGALELAGLHFSRDTPDFQKASFTKRVEGIKNNLVRYIRFPLFSFWTRIFSQVDILAPSLVLAAYFPMDAVGYYFLTYRILNIPMQVLGQPLKKAYSQHAAEKIRANRGLIRSSLLLCLALCATVALPGVVVYSVPKRLLTFVFGSGWGEVKTFLVILYPLYALRFIMNPLALVLSLVQLQHWQMCWQLVLAAVTITSLVLGSRTGSLAFALRLYSVANSAIIVGIILISFYAMHKTYPRQRRDRLAP